MPSRPTRRIAPLIVLALAGLARAGDGLVLLPTEIRLDSPEAAHRLLAQRTSGGEPAEHLASGLEWESSDPKVATVDGVDTSAGRVTSVLALARALTTPGGSFGVSGADGPVPLG